MALLFATHCYNVYVDGSGCRCVTLTPKKFVNTDAGCVTSMHLDQFSSVLLANSFLITHVKKFPLFWYCLLVKEFLLQLVAAVSVMCA